MQDDKPQANTEAHESEEKEVDAEQQQQEKDEPGENEAASKQQRSRKLLSACSSVEPWLTETFPLDSKEVIIVHVKHKTAMLPHFQIRLTSGGNYDGKTFGLQRELSFSIFQTFRMVSKYMFSVNPWFIIL